MALPQPTFLPYQPSKFVDASSAVTLGMQLFGKYHPSQLQQLRYQQMLQEREGKERNAQEELKTIADERAAIRRYQTSFREAGLGPSGKFPLTGSRQAGGRGGGGGGGGESLAGVLNAAAKFSANTTERRDVATSDRNAIERKYDVTSGVGAQFIDEVLRTADAAAGGGSLDTKALMGAIVDAARGYRDRLEGVQIPGQRKEMIAARLFDALKGRYGSNVDANVARLLEAELSVPGFLSAAIAENRSPTSIIRERQQAELRGVVSGPDRFEQFAFDKLQNIDLNRDGQVSDDERRTYENELAAFRQAYGLAEPLTDEEEVFLNRYIQALSDDGRADPSEFAEGEYEKALAAYEKGRNLESLPRGYARFYDRDYLRSIERDVQLGEREAALRGRETPQQQAAQALLGLPTVSAEAFQAAAQVSPRAAEALPYMIQRFQQANGDVQPRDRVERTAQQLITTSTERDFNTFMQQIDKLYPNDNSARLKAAAYFGAAQYGADARRSTFDVATQQGDVPGMARGIQTAAQQFRTDVEQTMPAAMPAAMLAPTPAPTPAPVMDPRQYVMDTMVPKGGLFSGLPTTMMTDASGFPINMQGQFRETARGAAILPLTGQEPYSLGLPGQGIPGAPDPTFTSTPMTAREMFLLQNGLGQ